MGHSFVPVAFVFHAAVLGLVRVSKELQAVEMCSWTWVVQVAGLFEGAGAWSGRAEARDL